MTADVVPLRPSTREQAIARHPATVSKRILGQVERQQMLHGLIAALGENRLNPRNDRDLPLIVGVLLVAAPQAVTQPRQVAMAVTEAAGAHRFSRMNGFVTVEGRTPAVWADEAAYGAAQLAAGTVLVAAYDLGPAEMLADWLETAGRS